ncbi:MAG: hypothetical protein EOP23_01180 [Hyphomicrobiales bacterium]|nr:MAG: hypothetical protein EOP23_01180 [Hyphomicrobiales bacterium]
MSVTMAARAHSGASLSAPVRRAQPARRKTSWLGRVARVAGQRPGRALVLLAFGIVSLAIVANALMFQKARHPAPMLSAPAPVSQPRASAERRAEPAPVVEAPAAQPVRPPARPNDLSQTQAAREAQPRPPAPVQAAPRAAAPAAPAPAPRVATPARDPIADLINGGDLRPPADVRSAGRSAAAPRT